MLPLLVIALPAAAGVAAFFVRALGFQIGVLLGTAMIHLVLTAVLWTVGPAAAGASGTFLGVDAAGLLFLSVTSLLFMAVSLYCAGDLLGLQASAPDKDARTSSSRLIAGIPRSFIPCLLWLLSTMSLVTLAQHLPLMWAAIEATTLASAPLIYFHRRGPALEATWKYLLICSVGIAIALLGTFFLGLSAAGAPEHAMSLSVLTAQAGSLSKPWLEAAFVLIVVGYGTKMGLAPLHTWLPDTYSQAPSSASALLSGALVNCPFLGILRFQQVCTSAGAGRFAGDVMLFMGFVSLAVAAAFMVGQRDYKRLLAYSSVENAGVLAVGVGLGGAGAYGALLHAVSNSLCKAGLFMLAGNVLRRFGTRAAADVHGLVRRLPLTGVLLVITFLAIGGAPPFGTFISDLTIFTQAIAGPRIWPAALFAILLAVAFLGMAGVLLPMVHGGRSTTPEATAPEPPLSVVPPLIMTAGALVLGLYVPASLRGLLSHASRLVGG